MVMLVHYLVLQRGRILLAQIQPSSRISVLIFVRPSGRVGRNEWDQFNLIKSWDTTWSRHPMVSNKSGQRDLSGRDELSSDPMDQYRLK